MKSTSSSRISKTKQDLFNIQHLQINETGTRSSSHQESSYFPTLHKVQSSFFLLICIFLFLYTISTFKRWQLEIMQKEDHIPKDINSCTAASSITGHQIETLTKAIEELTRTIAKTAAENNK